MTIEVLDHGASLPIALDAAIEQVATGFVFTEGALWHSQQSYLLFSDIIGNQMHRWDAEQGLSSFRQPSQMANGNAWDREGRLLTCEHASSRVTRTEPDGSITVLASHFEGRALNSPNDIVVRTDGSIYFTDPIFGRRAPHGVPREPELDHSSVYRIDPRDGSLSRLSPRLEQPNGLCCSLDEALLYVNDSPRKQIHVYDLERDGSVSAGRLFAEVPGDEPGVPDGMKVDLQGTSTAAGRAAFMSSHRRASAWPAFDSQRRPATSRLATPITRPSTSRPAPRSTACACWWPASRNGHCQ